MSAPTTSSSVVASTPNPTTPPYPDDVQWITAYLVIHMMSPGSYWYAYLLWIIVGFIFLLFTLLHWTGSRGGYTGALWSKWALRRRTWRGRHALELARRRRIRPQPTSLPSNGQLLCLVTLFIATVVLSFAGPDFIARASTPILKRDIYPRASYDISTFFPLQPQYQISKAWWTSGGRTGIIAFALMPLCVLFALKAPPFAIFALPFTTQLYFDKLAWLHGWSGRLIWVISALHVVLWSIQLSQDRRPGTGKIAYTYAWQYEKFIYGWTAFVLLTALTVLSTFPLRKRHYEAFYALHVLLVPLTLVMAALHHPPVWWWCWIALGLWIGERLWRGTWWLHLNGFLGCTSSKVLDVQPSFTPPSEPNHEGVKNTYYPPSATSSTSPYISEFPRHQSGILVSSTAHAYMPPPGFAYAELLSGATVRLTFISPGFLSWAPGQHFLINIPSVSRFTSHPFTVASVCDEQAPSDAGRAMVFLIRAKSGWTKDLWDHVISMMSLGQTHVAGEDIPKSAQIPSNGVLLRMYADGPFGSAIRAQWRQYSTVLVIVGGSGVSFGLSILQFICLCLAGRDGRYLGGHTGGWGTENFKVRRLRFVWIIREYAHVQWCASILRRCTAMISSPGLEVNIFVTNPSLSPSIQLPPPSPSDDQKAPDITIESEGLVPPSPAFVQDAKLKRKDSDSSIESDTTHDSYIDPNPVVTVYGDEESDIGDARLREIYTLYLTNFDGDNETSLPGEDALNRRVQKSGKMRRAKSRKVKNETKVDDTNHHLVSSQQDHETEKSHRSISSTERLLTPTWRALDQHIDNRGGRHTEYDPLSASTPKSSTQLLPHHHWPESPSIRHSLASSHYSGDDSHPASPLSPFPKTDADPEDARGVLRIHVDPREMQDISIVSEHARLGKPILDRLLEDEVQVARGPVIVACCGPTSLNAMVRKSIAKQINPARIRRGDMRGFINLVSEEFEY